MKTISRTMIGSHMWKMNHEDSDEDYFEIYMGDTKKLLMGIPEDDSTFMSSEKVDIHKHEVGKVVNQLLKGNINFIVGVTSPLVKYADEESIELRKITINNLSKNCYYSIKGMSKHNYQRYFEDQHSDTLKTKEAYTKKCNQIIRYLDFGIDLLTEKELNYKKIESGTVSEIKEKIDRLDKAFEESPLPEKVDEKPFRNYLYRIRLGDLK